jgi:magnesium-transporting ATPase (P-type)
VEGIGGQTRFAQILALMESASLQKPRLAQLADRIARPFLVAVLLAAGLAVVWWWPSDPGHALMVAVAVLIVTCPCALSLATPVAMLTAAGTLARHGVLVRNLQGLEALASVDALVFDKTGTLTRDGMAVHSVRCAPGLDRDEALALAATLARQSMHPASRAIVAAAPADSTRWSALSLREEAGQGLTAEVHDASGSAAPRWLRLGSARHAGVPAQDGGEALQVVLSGQGSDGQFTELARFDVIEDVRPEAAEVVRALQQAGVSVQILSGDRLGAVQRVATQAGISQAQGECTPQDKLVALQGLQAQGRHVAMVGDGLNDGPVLAGAHVSFAFGRSVPLAQSRADFVVLGGSLSLVAQAVLLARRPCAWCGRIYGGLQATTRCAKLSSNKRGARWILQKQCCALQRHGCAAVFNHGRGVGGGWHAGGRVHRRPAGMARTQFRYFLAELWALAPTAHQRGDFCVWWLRLVCHQLLRGAAYLPGRLFAPARWLRSPSGAGSWSLWLRHQLPLGYTQARNTPNWNGPSTS